MEKKDKLLTDRSELIYDDVVEDDESPVLAMKNDLNLRILHDEYKAGERIPAVRDLAVMYKVSIATAQKTVSQMRVEGTILRRRGVGYFVKPDAKKMIQASMKADIKSQMQDIVKAADAIGDIDVMEILKEVLEENSR